MELVIHKSPDIIRGTMSTWRYKPNRRKPSQTAGKAKRSNCQATGLDKFFAKRNRSYKHKDYFSWPKTGK